MCCVHDFSGPSEESRSFWIFEEDTLCAVLQTVVVNCQKRAVDFHKGLVNLIKMHLSLISCDVLICDTHMQLLR